MKKVKVFLVLLVAGFIWEAPAQISAQNGKPGIQKDKVQIGVIDKEGARLTLDKTKLSGICQTMIYDKKKVKDTSLKGLKLMRAQKSSGYYLICQGAANEKESVNYGFSLSVKNGRIFMNTAKATTICVCTSDINGSKSKKGGCLPVYYGGNSWDCKSTTGDQKCTKNITPSTISSANSK